MYYLKWIVRKRERNQFRKTAECSTEKINKFCFVYIFPTVKLENKEV